MSSGTPLLRCILSTLAFGTLALAATQTPAFAESRQRRANGTLPNPILFVTQMPIPEDGGTIGSIFANHMTDTFRVGRGGDLYLLYPDGTLRNLTQEAGYGNAGFQGATSIAVRDPVVHWSGTKALFSMVVGAPTGPEEMIETTWQLYEVSGLGQGQAALIERVPNQHPDTNNVDPVYGSDGRIIFVSDLPRDGQFHHYPQLDEYDAFPTTTGLWSLDPATGDLGMLNHSPSGAFDPRLDSFGRVVFTRWDHMTRDKQALDDSNGADFGTFNWSGESPDAVPLDTRVEVFPEPLFEDFAALAGTNLVGHDFNSFFPWTINQDGSGEETLAHIGRHELSYFVPPVFNDDPSLEPMLGPDGPRFNPNAIENLVQIRESAVAAGSYIGVDCLYDGTHSSGRIFSVTAPPDHPADQIAVSFLTHPNTFYDTTDAPEFAAGHTGFYRNPLPLSDGTLIVVHTPHTIPDANLGTPEQPDPRYDLRLKSMVPDGPYQKAGAPLTPGIVKTVSYWSYDLLVEYSGPMWELEPVEVVSRPVPPLGTSELPPVEAQVLADANVDEEELRIWLAERDLALLVSRDVTTRDAADRQQPFNLEVPGTGTQTLSPDGGLLYQVAHLQFFQGDLIRGMGGTADPLPGRRVLAQPLHEQAAVNPPNPEGPPGSVKIAADGSIAALVPARRAMTWQTTDGSGTPVVRERYWLTFQPGEIRVCTSCHGLNSVDQAGDGPPVNPPQALRELLRGLPLASGAIFGNGFESGDLWAWGTQ